MLFAFKVVFEPAHMVTGGLITGIETITKLTAKELVEPLVLACLISSVVLGPKNPVHAALSVPALVF